jgi:hypothetical protein
MRKWNLSTHIHRRHPGQFDPFVMSKNIVLKDRGSMLHPQTQSKPFNYSSVPLDWSDPVKLMEREGNYRNLLEQIKKLDKIELRSLMFAIFQLPQLNHKNYKF